MLFIPSARSVAIIPFAFVTQAQKSSNPAVLAERMKEVIRIEVIRMEVIRPEVIKMEVIRMEVIKIIW